MTTYSVLDLGDTCVPYAVSRVGSGIQITGLLWLGIQGVPFLWDGAFKVLTPIAGPATGWGSSVNSRGDAVGTFADEPETLTGSHAFLKLHGGSTVIDFQEQFLSSLGALGSRGDAMNDRTTPDVVGRFVDQHNQNHVWLYSGDVQSITDLTVTHPEMQFASGITNSRLIVGTRNDFQQLSILDVESNHLTSFPTKPLTDVAFINENGQVAGSTADGVFARQTNGAIISFGNSDTYCGGLNNIGQMVASDDSDVFVSDPILPADTAITLTSLNGLLSTAGWKITSATGIDDAGDIVGLGLRDDGNKAHGVLLTPDSPIPGYQPGPPGYQAAFGTILYGIISDGGGFGFPWGRVPPGPDGPWNLLKASQRDIILGLAINAGASMITDRGVGAAIERLSAQLVSEAGQRLSPAPSAQAAVVAQRDLKAKFGRPRSRWPGPVPKAKK